MKFGEKLDEIVNSSLAEDDIMVIISTLEAKAIELRIKEREANCVLVTGPIGTICLPD
ncbi:hypothetical protein [Bradyrhizobium sp. Ai1a-2]|uniref:hypothetical protein n=1 Tax=Bradyrhizobium sp. Ai1a-2 TaxID=196490 RepID=UPI0004013840|nr:hypothetical protein [Bradyrhizobium sp. Ai1a-2]